MADVDNEVLDYSSEDEKKPKVTKNTAAKNAKAKAAPAQKKNLNLHASSFNDFHLRQELMRAIGEVGFEGPSEVQSEGIPNILYGSDVLCQAKSGTGKTAVFVLGVLHSLTLPGDPFQCLVICNTRELAFQICKEFERLGKYLEGLKTQVIYGGVNAEAQILQLENNAPHIVIGTPGRTLDLVKKDKIKLNKLRYFVIDECDKVLEEYGMFSFL